MSAINLEIYLLCQKLYGVAKLEYASQNLQRWSTFIKECKRMFPDLPDTVYCIPQIVDLKKIGIL